MSTMNDEPRFTHDGIGRSVKDERFRLDPQLLLVTLGAVMLLCSLLAYRLFETTEQPALLAMLAAVLLGIPITWNTLRAKLFPKRRGPAHTEELVMLAFLASFASGRYVEAGSVALFMFTASFIVDRTAAGAWQTIELLIRITPKRARRLTDGSHEEQEVPAEQLQAGDQVMVRPGDQVPCDGRVVGGSSTLDEKYITGESHPIDKTADDHVFAGSMNLTGALRIEVQKPVADSTLGQVQSLILQAANYKTPVTQMLDRFAGHYTPVILCLAAVVFFFTQDLALVISLLLIACPMEIIISGPTALVAALTSAARLGVLVKNATDIELAGTISAVVFDKTGTLTTGNLAVTRLRPAAATDPADLLGLAASLEQHSQHPIARAVVAMAQRAKLTLTTVDDFEEVPGCGVRGRIDGRTVLAGREAWIRQGDVRVPPGLLDDVGSMSVLLLAEGGSCIGWIGLEDTPRDGAPAVLNDLRQLGVQQRMMVSGDRRGCAERVAQSLDLTGMIAEALPGDKLDIVRNLKRQGHTVAVVGDGVNDGPALAAADLSIAMGAAGSDVAINAASIALLNSQLDRLPFLIRLSRATTRVIRQNIVFVVLYIVTMVTLLALGHITPMMAAIAHGISSVVVVFNSARLIRQGEDLPLLEAASHPGTRRVSTASNRATPTAPPVVEADPVIGRIAG